MLSEATLTLATRATYLHGLLARAGEGNPNHKGSGPGGGQFTSGSGGGGSSAKHGKHWAKRQRRKARVLNKLKAKAHAKALKTKEKHRAERKALREKHRSEGTKYSERRTQTKALAAKQHTERQEVTKELRGEIRKEAESLKVARPADTSKTDKAKEFGTKREKLDALFKETGQEALQKNAARHQAERKEAVTALKNERAELRQKFDGERTELRDQLKTDYKDDRQIGIDNAGDSRKAKLAAIRQNQDFYRDHFKDSMADLRQTHSDQLEDHREHAKMVMDRVVLSQKRETIAAMHTNREARKSTIGKLKGILDLKYPTKGGDRGQRSVENRGRDLHEKDGKAHRSGELRSGGASPRFAASRVHKASSAESIVSHVLRQRGWTSRWDTNRLTDRQRVRLLEDIRQYGRQWLRHEVEVFFERYGDAQGHIETRSAVASRFDAENADGSLDARGASGGDESPDPGRTGDDVTRAWTGSRGIFDRLLSPLKRWFDRMRSFVHELIVAGAVVLKGSELTAQEAEQADQLAVVQAKYLDRFEEEIRVNPPREIAELNPTFPTIVPAKPPMSQAQIGARAELYATSAWQGAQKITRASKRRTGNARWERRILGHPKTEHCTDCPPLAALGWQPVGTLPDIGESECGPLCLCHFEYSDEVAMPTAKRPKPTPKPTRPKGVGAPAAKVEVIQPAPTTEEIDAEVKKWIAGEPSKLTVKKKYAKAHEPEFVLPEGYEWSE